jgi:hypothetical protein
MSRITLAVRLIKYFSILALLLMQTVYGATDIEALRAQAEGGDSVSQRKLGFAYLLGNGVTQDDAESVKWFRMAAEQGRRAAQYQMGEAYHEGRGVPQSVEEAIKWWRLAAAGGHPDAPDKLKTFDVNSNQSPRVAVEESKSNAPKRVDVAVREKGWIEFLRKKAEQGDVSAQRRLGGAYYSGKVVKRDYVESVKWYRMAAEQNDGYAMIALGQAYFDGEGVKKDRAVAIRLWSICAERGFLEAQNKIAAAYYYGDAGLRRNYIKCLMWTYIADANGGYGNVGRHNMEEMKRILSAREQREARKLADEWLAARGM